MRNIAPYENFPLYGIYWLELMVFTIDNLKTVAVGYSVHKWSAVYKPR